MADLNSTIVRGKLRVTQDEYISGNITATRLTLNGAGSNSNTPALNINYGPISISNYGVTTTIGALNSGFCHFQNSGSTPFYFNKTTYIDGALRIYNSSDSATYLTSDMLSLIGAASNPSASAGARIVFQYYNSASDKGQPVYLSYCPNDSYRAPYGLKVWGSAGTSPGAWFEVEGNIYAGGTLSSAGAQFNGNIVLGSGASGATQVGANLVMGIQNDSYGLLPYANNWNQIGADGRLWYRAFIYQYYGNTSHVLNWDSNKNIGTPNTSSAASTLGYVNFYNTAAANATQTKTTLTADSSVTSNITVTLPSATGTIALVGDNNHTHSYLPLTGGTTTGTTILNNSFAVYYTVRDSDTRSAARWYNIGVISPREGYLTCTLSISGYYNYQQPAVSVFMITAMHQNCHIVQLAGDIGRISKVRCVLTDTNKWKLQVLLSACTAGTDGSDRYLIYGNVTFDASTKGYDDTSYESDVSEITTRVIPNSPVATMADSLPANGGTSSYTNYLNITSRLGNGANKLQYLQYAGADDNPTNDWYSHIVMHHNNSSGYYTELATHFHGDNVYFRRKAGSDIQDWRRFAFTGEAQPADGGNSDTVDGLHASNILQWTTRVGKPNDNTYPYSNFNDAPTGVSEVHYGGYITNHPTDWEDNTNHYGAMLHFGYTGDNHSQILLDRYTDNMYFRNAGSTTYNNWYKVIHSGNIGSQAVSSATALAHSTTTPSGCIRYNNTTGVLHIHSSATNEKIYLGSTNYTIFQTSSNSITTPAGNTITLPSGDNQGRVIIAAHDTSSSGDYGTYAFGSDSCILANSGDAGILMVYDKDVASDGDYTGTTGLKMKINQGIDGAINFYGGGLGIQLNTDSTLTSSAQPGTARGNIYIDTKAYGSGADITNGNLASITFGTAGTTQAGIYVPTSGSYGTKMLFCTTDDYSKGSKTRMMINHDGKVGIGTVGPSYNLDVNGTLNATTIYENGATLANTYQAKGDYAASSHVHTYVTSDYKYTGENTYNVANQAINDSATSDTLTRHYNGTLYPVFHTTDWGWSDTLYWSGYDKWGGTELATQYNARSNVRVKIRKYNQTVSGWGDWTEFITSGNIGDQSVNYATSAGSATDSTKLPLAGGTMTGLLTTTKNDSGCGILVGNTYINAIEGDLIFQGNNSIRFGGSSWDWNVWAGLKYDSYNHIIYLGTADGSVFTANSGQSGTIRLPGISDLSFGTTNTYGGIKYISGSSFTVGSTSFTLNSSNNKSVVVYAGHDTGDKGTYVFGSEGCVIANSGDANLFQIFDEDQYATDWSNSANAAFLVSGSSSSGAVTAGSFYAKSDRRLKENIVKPDLDCLALINKLHLKEYNFKSQKIDKDKNKFFGLIAQDLLKALPEKYKHTMVDGSTKKNDRLTINEGKFQYITMGAVQQLSKKCDQQQKQIDKLTQENKELKSTLKQLIKRLEKLENQ